MRGAAPSTTRFSEFVTISNVASEWYGQSVGVIDRDGTLVVPIAYTSDNDGIAIFGKLANGLNIGTTESVEGHSWADIDEMVTEMEESLGYPIEIVSSNSGLVDSIKAIQSLFTSEQIGSMPRSLRLGSSRMLGSVVDYVPAAYIWPNGSVERAGISGTANAYVGNTTCPDGYGMRAVTINVTDARNYTIVVGGESYVITDASLADGIFLPWYV